MISGPEAALLCPRRPRFLESGVRGGRTKGLAAATVEEAIQRAEAILTAGSIPESQHDPRRSRIASLAIFVATDPDAVWTFVGRWGAHPDATVRAAIATFLLEQLLDMHFERCFPDVEVAVRRSPHFADTFLQCYPFGEASEPANAKRFDALRVEAGTVRASR